MYYRFGDSTLDTQRYELCRAGQLVPLRPKVFHVLAYLLTHREEVVSKDTLMAQVWPGQCISDETLSSCITAARRAVGDNGEHQHVIQTRRGHGYRFVAAVEVDDHPLQDHTPLEAPLPGALAEPMLGPATRVAGPSLKAALAEGESSRSGSSFPLLAPPRQLLQRALTGEHKVVTVLVGTLAPATLVTQRQEAEARHQALQALCALALEVIQAYEGTLQSVRDEGFLALFGAPVAQEDHAVRAVRAAWELQQRLRTGPVDPAWPLEAAGGVRLGLHTGPILLGSLGEDRPLTYTAVGDTTQHAAWLAQQAAPGAILVSAATAQSVQGEVRLEAGALAPRRGPTEPGSAYQVCGLEPSRSPWLPDGARPRSRFVGRELELTTLRVLLTRAAEGQGQVVGIVGEPGMGKTRLLTEFWQRLGDTPVTTLAGRCVSYGEATPYLPLGDLLRHACGLAAADSPAAISAKVQQHLRALGLAPVEATPLLLHLLGVPEGAAQLVGRSPQEIRTQTFATLHQLLRHASHRQPLLVVVENLHWIDPTSQEYLAELVEQLPSLPLLLLVTFRPGYRPPWMEKSYATQLALPRLGPADSRCVVQAVLHPAPVPEPLMQSMLVKAAGNPFFLEELAWTVREYDALQLPPDVPATIHAVLAARLDRLPPAAKQVLQTAAVIGPEVRLALLQALSPLPDEVLEQSLHALHTAEFLYATRPAPDRTYAFKHVLTQEAAYQSLLTHTRQQAHRQIAQVLEAQFPATVATKPELLAQHYTEAGCSAQAIPYWQQAGQGAVERSAHLEAISHLTRGLTLLMTLPETPARIQQEIIIQIRLGQALMATRGLASPDVERAYDRARALCHQVEETPQLFHVLSGLRGFYEGRGELQTARELGEQLLTLAQCAQDPVLLSLAHRAHGTTLLWLGEFPQARAHLEQGSAPYDPRQPRPTALRYKARHDGRVTYCRLVAITLWYLGYPDQALQRSREACTLAQENAHPYDLAYALYNAAILHSLRRETQTAQARAEAALGLARQHGFAHIVATGTCLRGWALGAMGQRAAGLAQMRQGVSAYRAGGAEGQVPYFLALLAEAYRAGGQAAEGLGALAEALTVVHKLGSRFCEAELYRLKGELLLRQAVPDAPQAETCWQQALTIAHHQQAKSLQLRAALSLSRLWQRQCRCAEARQLLAPLYGWFTEGFDTPDLQDARALLADLA